MTFMESVHRDEDIWEKPNDFYPEHFLDEDGKFTLRKDAFLPFSTGNFYAFSEK